MGRARDRHQDQPYPAVPPELLALINDQGLYRFSDLVEVPGSNILGRSGSQWDTYKRLKQEYCDAAGIPLSGFKKVVLDQQRVDHPDLGPRRKSKRRSVRR